MKNLKQQIIDILNSNAYTDYGKGSCGELGDSYNAIDADDFDSVADEIINLIEVDKTDFNKAVEPAIRYLLNNHHPHTKIYIDYSSAELVEGLTNHNLNNEIPD